MRIRKPRSLTGAQIGFATVLGVIGGYYIWKPVFAPNVSVEKSTEQSK